MQPSETIAITGSSGYLGRKLVQRFRGLGHRIVGIDVVANEDPPSKPDVFIQADICDESLPEKIAKFSPNTIVHGAFVFQPRRNAKKTRKINVDGTRNVFSAAVQSAAKQLMIVSSATAYGAWEDNPVPMDESWQRRSRNEFQYAANKHEVEQLTESFAKEHPEIATCWVRPAIIAGPNFSNYLSRFIFGLPLLIKMDGFDSPLQFVHEDDVVESMAAILAAKGQGGFNIGPDDWLTIDEIANLTNRKALSLPFWLVRWIHGFAWLVRFPIHESPAGFLYFARYPWVVASKRLQQEIGYQFKYSCRETVDDYLEAEKVKGNKK